MYDFKGNRVKRVRVTEIKQKRERVHFNTDQVDKIYQFCFPLLGLRQEENTQHHVFRTKKNKVSVRRTPVNLRKWKTTVGIKKKDTVQKSGLFHADNNDEIAQDELLVKELALSSDIGEVKKSTAWAKGKKHKITKNYPPGKTKEPKTKARYATPAMPLSTRTHKRTSIAMPEPGKSRHVHPVSISRTLLTAVGLLLDGRNHFVKDSNALSLAKVLLDNGNKTNEKQTTFSSGKTNSVSLSGLPSGFGLSNILRLLNASPSQQSQTGERKSTIHTELINPTELGVSILRLLFGHKAPLVMKSTYKPLFLHNPTVSSSTTRLADQRKQFNKVKAIVRSKKHRKKSFSFALAKAVSDLIKSMAREELRNYLQNIHQNPKPKKNIPSSRELSNVWPANKVVDVQGNRKSWVLLKIPKSGEEIVPPKELSNDPLEEEETDTGRQSESVKEHAGIVDTLGKLNDLQPVSQEMLEKEIAGPSRSAVTNETRGIPNDVKVQPTSRVGYSVRILPSLKGSAVKEPDSYHVNRKPARKPQPASQSTAVFADAVKKLIQAVQSSIKSLQGKQLIGYPTDLNSLVRNQLPSLQSGETTNTGSVRGIKNDPTRVNYAQPEKKSPFLQDNKGQEKPRFEELSAFTRAAGQEEPPKLAHANVLFDPLKDLVMSPSEPITKSVSPTKPLGPSDNVLFESATELGIPRDRQESSEVQHIKEGNVRKFAKTLSPLIDGFRRQAAKYTMKDNLCTFKLLDFTV